MAFRTKIRQNNNGARYRTYYLYVSREYDQTDNENPFKNQKHVKVINGKVIVNVKIKFEDKFR